MDKESLLHYREYPCSTDTPLVDVPVFLLHGLFAASDNFHSIGLKLKDYCRVIVPDLRNHGASFHHPDTSYGAMADDLAGLMDELGISRAVIVGHSMGGKTAMKTALSYPGRVAALVVEDIGPGAHVPRYRGEVQAMAEFDPSAAGSRKEALESFLELVDDARVGMFLLKNLMKDGDGHFRWRHNIRGISLGYGEFWKAVTGESVDMRYDGPVLFIRGSESRAVTENDLNLIPRVFPRSLIRSVEKAGHWVHAEHAEAFLAEVVSFLSGLDPGA
ncbi:MAG: alpha/beta fold hydrolase [Spirochaetales bacterium]|nr:alpha/beta fold hydrolase [Spirochaetales bacterium]